jgi:hypothetical protein
MMTTSLNMKDRDDDVDYPTHSGILVMSMSAASYRFRSVSSPPLSNHDLNLSGGFGSLLFVEEEKEEARATSDSIISCPLLAPGVANEQVREPPTFEGGFARRCLRIYAWRWFKYPFLSDQRPLITIRIKLITS